MLSRLAKEFGFEEELVQPSKRIRGGYSASTSATLPAFSVLFRAAVFRATFESVRRD